MEKITVAQFELLKAQWHHIYWNSIIKELEELHGTIWLDTITKLYEKVNQTNEISWTCKHISEADKVDLNLFKEVFKMDKFSWELAIKWDEFKNHFYKNIVSI